MLKLILYNKIGVLFLITIGVCIIIAIVTEIYNSIKIEREKERKLIEEIKDLKAKIMKYDKDKEDEPKIINRLVEELKKFCTNHNIEIHIGNEFFENNEEAAGYILYNIRLASKEIFSYRIYLREEDKYLPTLAHEIGHYLALSKYADITEKSADVEARLLCEKILTKEELDNELIGIMLDCYFVEKDELDNYEYSQNSAYDKLINKIIEVNENV